MTIAEHFRISPLEVYERWEYLKVIVTYVDIHNKNITNYIIEDRAAKGVNKRIFRPEEEYIRNETLDDIQKLEEETSEAQKELDRIYGGD